MVLPALLPMLTCCNVQKPGCLPWRWCHSRCCCCGCRCCCCSCTRCPRSGWGRCSSCTRRRCRLSRGLPRSRTRTRTFPWTPRCRTCRSCRRRRRRRRPRRTRTWPSWKPWRSWTCKVLFCVLSVGRSEHE